MYVDWMGDNEKSHNCEDTEINTVELHEWTNQKYNCACWT